MSPNKATGAIGDRRGDVNQVDAAAEAESLLTRQRVGSKEESGKAWPSTRGNGGEAWPGARFVIIAKDLPTAPIMSCQDRSRFRLVRLADVPFPDGLSCAGSIRVLHSAWTARLPLPAPLQPRYRETTMKQL